MAAKLKWPHEYAGGTGAAPGRNGYLSESTPFGYWTVDPVTYPNGRHRGYVAGFVNDKGAVPGDLHQRIGGWSKVFRSAREAKAAAADSYAGLLVGAEVKQNPAVRPSAIPKSVRDFALRHKVSVGRDSHGVYYIREHGQVVETTRSAKPSAANAIAMIKRHLRQHQKEGAYPVAKKNPRRRMGVQARKDFARRMAAARERAQAKKRVAIKRQIRSTGQGAGMDPNLPTRVLRAQRKATQAKGMYQIGGLSSTKKLAWLGYHGFTLLRGEARGFASLGEAKARARSLQPGLVAGIFRSDVSAERARQFLLGKQ